MLAVTIGLLLTLALAVVVMAVVTVPHLRDVAPLRTPDGARVVGRPRTRAREKPRAAAIGTRQRLIGTWQRLVVVRQHISTFWTPISLALHRALDHYEGQAAARADRPPAPVVAPVRVEKSSRETDFIPRVDEPGDRGEPAELSSSPRRPVPVSASSTGRPGPASEAPSTSRTAPAAGTSSTARGVPVGGASSTGRSTSPGAGGSSSSINRRSSGGGTAAVGRPRSFPAISGPIPEITDDLARPAPARTGAGAPDSSRVIDLRDDSDLNHETGIARRAR